MYATVKVEITKLKYFLNAEKKTEIQSQCQPYAVDGK